METSFAVFDTRLRAAVGKEPLYAWAARVGINKGTLNSALSRKAIPKAELLIQMANSLDCSVDYLLGRCDDPTPCAPAGAASASHAALAEAIQSINQAYANITKLARQNALSVEEQQLVDAFRAAGPERKQIFLDLARPSQPAKRA